jgi:hypothetical protein
MRIIFNEKVLKNKILKSRGGWRQPGGAVADGNH